MLETILNLHFGCVLAKWLADSLLRPHPLLHLTCHSASCSHRNDIEGFSWTAGHKLIRGSGGYCRWRGKRNQSSMEPYRHIQTSMPAVMPMYSRMPLKAKVCWLTYLMIFFAISNWMQLCFLCIYTLLSSHCITSFKTRSGIRSNSLSDRSGRGCDHLDPGEEKQRAATEDQSSLWGKDWWGEFILTKEK